MNTFTLQIGSEFNRGAAIWRIVRQKDVHTFIIENTETGEVITLSAVELSKEIQVSGSELGSTDADIRRRFEKDFKLPEPSTVQRVSRKLRYVKHIRQHEPFLISGKKVAYLMDEAKELMGDPCPPDPKTVERWLKRFDEGLSLEITRRPKTQRLKQKKYQVALALLKKHYCNRDQETLVDVYARYCVAARQEGFAPLKIKAFGSLLKTQFARRDVDKARLGVSEANKRYRISMKAEQATRVYEVLELDHTVMDFVVVSEDRLLVLGRPTLVCITDVASRYVVAAYLTFEKPSVKTVFAALKMAFLPKDMSMSQFSMLREPWLGYGMPETIVFDNGMENHSKAIEEFFVQSKVIANVEYSASRSPWHKPHIEGFFSRAAKGIKTESGRVVKIKDGVVTDQADKTAALTFSELRSLFYRWLEDIHNRTPNSRSLLVPRDEFLKGLNSRPPLAIPVDARYFDLFSMRRGHRTVSAGGIQLHQLIYSGSTLHAMRNQYGEKFTTEVRFNPDNLESVYVLHPQTKHWVLVPCINQNYANGLCLREHIATLRARAKNFRNSGAEQALIEARVSLLQDTKKLVGKGKRAKTKNLKLLNALAGEAKNSPSHRQIDEHIKEINVPEFVYDPLGLEADPVQMWEDLL